MLKIHKLLLAQDYSVMCNKLSAVGDFFSFIVGPESSDTSLFGVQVRNNQLHVIRLIF